MIKLGCCTFNYLGWPLERQLRAVADLGFKLADAGFTGADGPTSWRGALETPCRTGEHIGAQAEQHGLELVELFACAVQVDGEGVRPSEPDPGRRDRMLENFRALCRCARAAGFESVMGVPGTPEEGVEPQEAWRTAAAALRRMVGIAADVGIAFNVEPHRGSLIEKPDAALRMADEVPGLAYTLDYTHFIGQEIPEQQVMPLHQYTRHMHAKPAYPGCFKCLVEDGRIDYGAVLADLQERGWDGVVAMECMYDPQTPILTEHPGVQSALLAHKLERTLEGLS